MKSCKKRIAMLAVVLFVAALMLAAHAEGSGALAAADVGVAESLTTSEPTVILSEDGVCNVPMHQVWPILFFTGLALNVAAVVVIVVLIWKKKHLHKDDIPLVDYDIDCDTDNLNM